MSSFCYINPKNSLLRETKNSEVINQILEKVSNIPNFIDLKHNLELLKLVCVCIEHSVNNKNSQVKIDKKDIVYQVYKKLYANLSPQDLINIGANVQYLWENKQIKKKKISSIIKHCTIDWFKRRIL
jgi:hypothetical protein